MDVDRLMSIFESVQSAAVRVNRNTVAPPRKRCPVCEDDPPRITADRLCQICGEVLETVAPPAPAVPASAADNSARDDAAGGWFELLNDDLRAAIQASLQQQAPSRQISPDYLSTLGKVDLDPRRGLLHDVVLHVGPLAMMAVPSAFGPLPSADAPGLAAPLVLGDPVCGDAEGPGHVLANRDACARAIVVLKRGKVSFVAKARAAQCSGALACVVINTMDTWPFVMTDTANEAEREPLSIPIVMVSQSDGEVIEGLLGKGGPKVEGSLRCGRFEPECSICQEEMVAGTCVLKLACRHAYHQACVYTWLQGHNTCPLCRNVMPANKNPKPADNRRQRAPEETHGHQPYFH